MAYSEPTITVYMTRKVNLGDYEMADVYMKWEGIPLTVGEGFYQVANQVTSSVVDEMLKQLEAKAEVIRERERARRRQDARREE